MVKKRLSAILCCGALLLASMAGCSTAKSAPAQTKTKGLYSGYENYKYYKKGKNLSGSIVNLGKSPVSRYDGYLGYGYDMVRSNYFNSGDIHLSNPILDENKLLADKLIYSRPIASTTVDNISGSSAESFEKNLSLKTNISASGMLFKADFSSSFSKSSSTSTNSSYVKTRISIGENREYVLLSDLTMQGLKKYMTARFKSDINNSKISAKTIFDTYGTHVLMDIMTGGRMDLNYSYKNTQNLSETDLSACASEVYRSVKAKESASLSEKAKSFFDNSEFTAKQYGGTTVNNITTLTGAQNAYTSWAASLENNKRLDFIGAADPNNTYSFIPVWNFADNTSRQNELKNYYNSLLEENNNYFSGNGNTLYYLKNVYLAWDNSTNEQQVAANKATASLVSEMQTNDPGCPNYIVKDNDNLPINLNDYATGWKNSKNSNGDVIFMGYTLTTNPDEAIRGLWLYDCDPNYDSDKSFGEKYKSDNIYNSLPKTRTKDGIQYTEINSCDLNGGTEHGDAIYLCYTKDKKASKKPLMEVGIERYRKDFNSHKNERMYSFSMSSDWSRVSDLDLNKRAGGADIYMWQRQSLYDIG